MTFIAVYRAQDQMARVAQTTTLVREYVLDEDADPYEIERQLDFLCYLVNQARNDYVYGLAHEQAVNGGVSSYEEPRHD